MTSPSIDMARIPSHLTDIPNDLRRLLDDQSGNIADWGLEALLDSMRRAFELSRLSIVLLFFPRLKGFDENLHNFSGSYVFGTKDGTVEASAVFKDEQMEVLDGEIEDWDVKILFEDARAFWAFIFSGGNDILQSVLANDVQVYGNLNFLYKFGFMARDLRQRLGLDFLLST